MKAFDSFPVQNMCRRHLQQKTTTFRKFFPEVHMFRIVDSYNTGIFTFVNRNTDYPKFVIWLRKL